MCFQTTLGPPTFWAKSKIFKTSRLKTCQSALKFTFFHYKDTYKTSQTALASLTGTKMERPPSMPQPQTNISMLTFISTHLTTKRSACLSIKQLSHPQVPNSTISTSRRFKSNRTLGASATSSSSELHLACVMKFSQSKTPLASRHKKLMSFSQIFRFSSKLRISDLTSTRRASRDQLQFKRICSRTAC